MLSVIGIIKSSPVKLLSLSSIVFFLVQSYTGPYDPWRGRYFIICAIIAVPTIIIWLHTTKKIIQIYIALVVLIGCYSAISTVIIRPNKPIIDVKYYNYTFPSIFSFDRIGQLTRNRMDYFEPIKKFYQLVPENATIAVLLPGDSYEYPLFGKSLTRTIIPINFFDQGPQPIPITVDFLLFSNDLMKSMPNDTPLGVNWFLRKLR